MASFPRRRTPRRPFAATRRSSHGSMLHHILYCAFCCTLFQILPEVPADAAQTDGAQESHQSSEEVKPLLCPGFSDLPSEFWSNLSEWQDRYGRDSTKMAAYFYELFVNRIDIDSLIPSIGDNGEEIDFYKQKENEWWAVSGVSDDGSEGDGHGSSRSSSSGGSAISSSSSSAVLTSWLEASSRPKAGATHEKKLAFYGGVSNPGQGIYELWKQILVNESYKRGFKEKWIDRLFSSDENKKDGGKKEGDVLKESDKKERSASGASAKSPSVAAELLRAAMSKVFPPSEEAAANESEVTQIPSAFSSLLPNLTLLTSALADALGGTVLDDRSLQKLVVARTLMNPQSDSSKSDSPSFPPPPRRKVLDEGLALCPTVVLEVMMNAVLHIDLNFGVHAARNFLLRIYRLRRRALSIIDSVIAEEEGRTETNSNSASTSVEVDSTGDARDEQDSDSSVDSSGDSGRCSPEAAAAREQIVGLARENKAKLEAQRKEWYDDIAYVYPKMLGLGRLGAMREAGNSDAGADGSGAADHGDENEDGIRVLLAGDGDDEDDDENNDDNESNDASKNGSGRSKGTSAQAEEASRKIETILDSFKANENFVTKDFLVAKRSAVLGTRDGGSGFAYLTADRFAKATEGNSGEERVAKAAGMKELLKTVRLFRVREIFRVLVEWEKESKMKKTSRNDKSLVAFARKTRAALVQASSDMNDVENQLRKFNEIIRINCDLDDPGSACFEAFDEGGALEDSLDTNNGSLVRILHDLLQPLTDTSEKNNANRLPNPALSTTLSAIPSSSSPFSPTSAVTALTPKNVNKEDCAGQKVFVYGDLDPTFYTPSLLRCLQGQWGTEVIMRAFLDTNCRTQNPEEADWFYVTLYGTCRYVALEEMQNIDVTELQKANETGQAPARINEKEEEKANADAPLGSTKNSRVAVAEREKKGIKEDDADGSENGSKDGSKDDSNSPTMSKDPIKNSPISNHFDLDWSVDRITNERIFDPLLLDHIRKSKWYHRRQGRDHIFLFADGQGPRIWDSYDMFRGASIFMSPEATCPTWREPIRTYIDVKECLSSWKDIIIPGHTDYARIQYMKKFDKPTELRRLLFTFHGRYPGLHEAYEHCTVRGDIMKIGEHHGINEGVDVGGFVSDYLERKGDSHFCLVPAGTSPWTNHLYESLYSGCIPVISSDEYVPAFREELPWQDFSIKWPESEVGEKLFHFLLHLVEKDPNAVVRLKYWGRHHACWFNWYSTDPTCSPYLLIMRRLRQLKNSRRAAPRFWNHEMAFDKNFDDEIRQIANKNQANKNQANKNQANRSGESKEKDDEDVTANRLGESKGYVSEVNVKGAYNAEKRREVARRRQIDDLPKFGDDAAWFAQLRRRTRFKSKDDESSRFVYLYSETKFAKET